MEGERVERLEPRHSRSVAYTNALIAPLIETLSTEAWEPRSYLQLWNTASNGAFLLSLAISKGKRHQRTYSITSCLIYISGLIHTDSSGACIIHCQQSTRTSGPQLSHELVLFVHCLDPYRLSHRSGKTLQSKLKEIRGSKPLTRPPLTPKVNKVLDRGRRAMPSSAALDPVSESQRPCEEPRCHHMILLHCRKRLRYDTGVAVQRVSIETLKILNCINSRISHVRHEERHRCSTPA